MIKLILGIVIGFLIWEFDVISSVSQWCSDYGVKEIIIEKLQDGDNNNLDIGGE
tara:strand:- start:798 stop:959 length:162 start_codon:yes stop_codon:yes gene_type:complete